MKQIIKERIEQINRGEMPEGYKKIINSVVPIDWEQRSFSKLFDFYGGLGKSRDELGETGIPYLHYGDMHRNTFSKVSYEQYLNEPKYDKVINGQETFLLNDGDVVFLDASEDLEGTSRAVMVDNPENKPFISGLHTIIGKGKKNYLQKEFKQYITEPFYVRKQFMRLASGFKVYGLNRETIKKIELAYPKDKTEQQKIAKILSTWDEAISLQEKLIEKLEIQKMALMKNLLNPKKKWKPLTLKNCGEAYGGLNGKNKDDFGKGYPFITYMNIFSNPVIDVNSFELVIVKDGEYQNKVKYGDIFFTTSSETPEEVGMASVLLNEVDKVYLNSFCFGYRLFDFESVLPEFAAYYFRSNYFRSILNTLAQGATRFNLSKKSLMEISIPFPDIREQRHIADILMVFVKTINLNKIKLEKLKQQQKSMHQLLLTGIVRVI